MCTWQKQQLCICVRDNEQSSYWYLTKLIRSHIVSLSPHSLLFQGYYFHTENPFKDWPGAFEEGLKKLREGDLPLTILYLEAAILQDPHDAEVCRMCSLSLIVVNFKKQG